MPNQFANFVTPLITGGAGGVGTSLVSTDTTVHVTTGTGANFPTVYPYQMAIGNPAGGASACEIVRVTASAGTDAFTIVRAQEGTNAQTWAVGVALQVGITALMHNALNHVYLLKMFGGKVDGATDDTAALNAAIAAAAAAGGGIVDIGPGTCIVSSTITIGNGSNGTASTINNVRVRGDGMYATSIKWNGSSGGTITQILGVCTGCMFEDLTIDGNSGLAGTGLLITSLQYANCPSLRIINTTVTCLKMTAFASLTFNQDCIGVHFSKVALMCGLGTVSVQSYGLWLDGAGPSGWDTTQCSFQNLSIWAQQNYNTALRWGYCDFNYFGVVNCFFNSSTNHFGLQIDGTVATNFPQNNLVVLGNFGGAFTGAGTPGTNYVQLYDTNDNAGAAPGLGTGLVGLAEAQGSEGPAFPFGTGAPVWTPGEALNSQLTTTSATNVVALTGPIAGLYLAVLNYRVVTASTTLTAVAKATDDSGSVQSYFFFSTAASGTGDFAVNGGSQTVGSYTCPPIALRYSGSGTVPTITVTAGTANQVFCSASIIKIG